MSEIVPTGEDCTTANTDENCDGSPSCTGSHEWSKIAGNSGSDQEGNDISADRLSNALVTGRFQGQIDFGNGPLTAIGGYDVYVAKIDPLGNAIWSNRYGNAAHQGGTSIATDADNNVLITGYMNGSMDFGNGMLVSAGSTDIFLAKFDPSGKALWSKAFGDASIQHGESVTTDALGNVYLTGHFTGGVDFGCGLLESPTTNVIIAKFSPAGDCLWSNQFGAGGFTLGKSVAVGIDGAVVVVGEFDGSVDFGGGLLTTAGNKDVFLVKFDNSGKHLWSKRFGDAAPQGPNAVAVDGGGNIILGGYFAGSIDFGTGQLTAAGNTGFLAHFDSSGKCMWSAKYDSASIYDVAVDGLNNIDVTGFFVDTADFGGGPMTTKGLGDVLLLKLNSSGQFIWNKGFGSVNSDLGMALSVDAGGSIFVAGQVRGTIDFGGGPLPGDQLALDAFVARFNP